MKNYHYKYFYKGKPLREYAQDVVEYKLWLKRIRAGWSIERAMTTPKLDSRQVVYYYNGRPAIDVARENGINNNVFRRRLYIKGWSIADACTVPAKKSKKQIEWEKNHK